MNKKFYFALALTAGLFASCSSDDLTAEAPQQGIEVNDNEPAQITISTGMATRGTGSVGFPTAKWDGQKFNIFMFGKGTFNAATYKAVEAGPDIPIYLNTEMTTDPNTQTANYVLEGNIQYNYFPGNGAFSFWAYRVDDALDETALDAAALAASNRKYTYVNDLNAPVDSTEATKVIVPIDIDGSQDIMVAIADTAAALTKLQGKVATATMDRIYTAYSARRAVNPQLQFNHLLTRLYFQVIADDRAVSNKADWIIADEAARVASGETFKGFKITQVRVKTKSKGHVVAAFKDLSRVAEPRLVFDDGQEWNLEADGSEPSTLKSVYLKTRDITYLPADYKMQAINPNTPSTTITVANAGYEYNGYSGAATFGLDPSWECYTYPAGTPEANMTDAQKGMPTGSKKTIAEAITDGETLVYLPTFKSGTRPEDGSTYDNYAESYDASAPLRAFDLDHDDLIPHWSDDYVAPSAGNPSWHALAIDDDAADRTIRVTAYNWEGATEAEYDAAVLAGTGSEVNVVPTTTTVGNIGDVVKCTDATWTVSYHKLTSKTWKVVDKNDNNKNWPVAGCADYTTLAGATTDPVTDAATAPAGADNQVVYVGGTGDPDDAASHFYMYYPQGAAGNPGRAEATPIGEALLVAPADDNGYFVEFTYTRFKKITDTHVEPITNTATIQVKAGAGFEAGKAYRITAKLYKDGDIVIGDDPDAIKPVDWGGAVNPTDPSGTDQEVWDLE